MGIPSVACWLFSLEEPLHLFAALTLISALHRCIQSGFFIYTMIRHRADQTQLYLKNLIYVERDFTTLIWKVFLENHLILSW